MILHISTSLDSGGAEALLANFVKTDKREEHVVISLSDDGFYGAELIDSGITVHALNMPRSRVTLGALMKLYRLIRHYDPRVIQTWMYHANFLAGIIGRLAGKNRIVWGLHSAELDPVETSFSARFCDRACALMSGFVPRRMVHSSVSGAAAHIHKGYSREKMDVVASGFNLDRYKPEPAIGISLRKSLGIPADQVVFGMVARFDPQKDHVTMMAAIEKLSANIRLRTTFVFVGSGCSRDNPDLAQLVSAAGLTDDVVLLGPRRDVPELMNLFDVHVLSSAFGESFPNVVNEAMATGVPCIVTDSGDSGLIVDDTGWMVPRRDAVALSEVLRLCVDQVGSEDWMVRKTRCRQRVLDNFTVDKMISNYHEVWDSID